MSRSRSSTSSENIQSDEDEIKLTTPKHKIDEIIKKSKQIVPWFKRYDLIRLFKTYYENESVYYNKIRSIANSQVEKDDDGWITNKKHQEVKTKPKQVKEFKEEQTQSKYQNYSFLKDEKLLKRIGKGDQQEDESNDNKKNKGVYKDKRDRQDYQVNRKGDKEYTNYSNNYQKNKNYPKDERKDNNKNKNTKQYDQSNDYKKSKQIKYKEKQPEVSKPKTNQVTQSKDNKTNSNQNTKTQVNTNSNNNNDKNKIIQKTQIVEKAIPIQTPKVDKAQMNKTAPLITPPQSVTQSKVQTSSLSESRTKKQDKIQSTTKNKKTEQRVVEQEKQKTNEKIIQKNIQKNNSKQESQIGLNIDQNVKQTFDRVCNQNPYILKFIVPIAKTQKIQYILDNKKLSNVKVRVVTDIQ